MKIFGKSLEEFRRQNFQLMELIKSDQLLSKGIPESMIRHAENVNIGSNRASEVGRLQGGMQI